MLEVCFENSKIKEAKTKKSVKCATKKDCGGKLKERKL